MRRAPSVDALIPALYLKGISTGDFSEALAAVLGEGASGLSVQFSDLNRLSRSAIAPCILASSRLRSISALRLTGVRTGSQLRARFASGGSTRQIRGNLLILRLLIVLRFLPTRTSRHIGSWGIGRQISPTWEFIVNRDPVSVCVIVCNSSLNSPWIGSPHGHTPRLLLSLYRTRQDKPVYLQLLLGLETSVLFRSLPYWSVNFFADQRPAVVIGLVPGTVMTGPSIIAKDAPIILFVLNDSGPDHYIV
jgi:hypothetical protein